MSANSVKYRPKFSFSAFLKYHVTQSVWLLLWTILLVLFSFWYIGGKLVSQPLVAVPILLIWAGTVIWMAQAEITKNHNQVTLWLKENLYSSITNALVSLILAIMVASFLVAFYTYAITNASFSEDPKIAAEVTQAGRIGARWGAVTQNFENMMVFRMKDEMHRIWASLALIVALSLPSLIVFRNDKYRNKPLRKILTWLWIVSPLILLYFLRGLGESGPFAALDITQMWGGLLFTAIIAIFAIAFSFPLGLLLALGRQSKITGIPASITYGAAIICTLLGLALSTPHHWQAATSIPGKLYAFWPLLILLIAYLFQRTFKGNVVAAGCTVYIECIRGVPLITLLFTGILLLGIFLPSGWDINEVVSVLVAYTLFSAAYLAENVRGGLQAIPKGQYESADSLGLSTYKKYRLIILPQALRIVIPAIVGQFISLFKDTSLVALVGLFDLLNIARKISNQQNWNTVRTEPFIFIFIVYFIGSSLMSSYSRRLERRLNVGQN